MQPQLLTVIKEETLRDWNAAQWSQWQVEAKRDGFRLLIVDGVPQSRSGKPLHNIQHILDQLNHHAKGVVFDGELHGSSWQETSHVARASKAEREIKLTYTIFDMLTIDEWRKQVCDRSLRERQHLMQKCTPVTEHVRFVSPHHVSNYHTFERLHREHLKQGCDGTVLKLADSLYEFKRTKTWLKVKPVETFDGKVMGVYPGEGKHEGRMGGLTVLFEDVNPYVTTRVGTGFSDSQREEWWHRNWITGRTVEVAARGVHKSGRLIEPRFIRIREDK